MLHLVSLRSEEAILSLPQMLEQLQFLEQQINQLDQEMASLLNQHQEAVQRLAEVPGLGVD